MDNRPALLCDRSTAFTDRLRRILREVGYDVRTVTGRKALLHSVKTEQPSIIFIAVDLPRKIGFSLFSDVKLASKKIPVVLITGSVPPEEMRIHQSLQLHADAYLDKRTLDNLELLTTVRRLLRLELSDRDLEGLARKTGSIESDETAPSEESFEEQIEKTISWDSESSEDSDKLGRSDDGFDAEFIQRPVDAAEPQRSEAPPEPSDADRNRALQAELERLKRELDEMRSAVRSTPFSEEYRSLKSRVVKSEEEAETLREQISSQLQHVRELEAKLVDAEFHVRSLRDSEAAAQEQVRSLEHQLAQAIQERVAVEHDWARSMEELKTHAESEKLQAARAAAEKTRKELEAFQRKHSETLATASERSHQEIAKAVEVNDAKWRSELAEADKKHASALEALKAEHQKEIARLAAGHSKETLEKEKEFKEAMARAASAHEEDLASNNARWKERLEKAREESEASRNADRAALKDRYRKELNDLRAQHVKERERLQKMHADGLESLSAKLRDIHQDPSKIKSPLLRAKIEEKLREREAQPAAEMKGGGEEG